MLSCRLLEEEAAKRAELEQMHLQQQRILSQTVAEKQEMVAEQLAKERKLQAAQVQLERLERERQGALEQYKVRSHMWMCLQGSDGNFYFRIYPHFITFLQLIYLRSLS